MSAHSQCQIAIVTNIQFVVTNTQFVTTNVKTLDYGGSYTLWTWANNRSLDQGLEGLNTSTIEMFKLKYFKMILTQYKVGQMVPYIDWPVAPHIQKQMLNSKKVVLRITLMLIGH